MASVFPYGNEIFHQDNDPFYKARIVLEWFQEHDAEFQLMSWPPNSPDFNPIENIGISWSGRSEFKYHQVAISWICVTVA